MKKLLIYLAFICFPVMVFSQLFIEPHNFYWRRVVDYPGTSEEIHDAIIESGIIQTITKDDPKIIIGKVENIRLKYKTIEPTPELFNKPIFFKDGEKFSGTLIYEIKDSCYRVTFKNLIYDSELIVTFGNVSADMRNNSVNDFFYKDDGRFCRGKAAQEFAKLVFDYSFSNSFIIKKQDETSDDW